MLKPTRIVAATRRPLDWRMQRMLRSHELPDIPEVRWALRAWSRKSWTLRAAPSANELRALHLQALASLSRARPTENAR